MLRRCLRQILVRKWIKIASGLVDVFTRQSKVSELEVPIFTHQHIFRLHVSIQYLLGVEVLDCQ
jgi:hypothetical protein